MMAFVLLLLWLTLVLSPQPQEEPCVIHLEVPIYHRLARQARLEGDIAVQVRIAPSGKVISAIGKVVSEKTSLPYQLLVKVAEENAQTWLFSPAAEERTIEILYEFRLEMPERYQEPPSKVILDLPRRVRITSNFGEINPQRER